MNHPAELQVFSYLQKAMKGEATMTEEVATLPDEHDTR